MAEKTDLGGVSFGFEKSNVGAPRAKSEAT